MENAILPLVAVWVDILVFERSYRETSFLMKVIGYIGAVLMSTYGLLSAVLNLLEYFA